MIDQSDSESARVLSDLAPNSLPHWANVAIVRFVIAVCALGVPGCGAIGWKVAASFQSQSRQIESLTQAVAGNSESIRDLVNYHRTVSEKEIAGINLKLAKIEAVGILPKAEREIDQLRDAVLSIRRELDSVAPSDVLKKVEELSRKYDDRVTNETP